MKQLADAPEPIIEAYKKHLERKGKFSDTFFERSVYTTRYISEGDTVLILPDGHEDFIKLEIGK